MFRFRDKSKLPTADHALTGRSDPITPRNEHFVNGHPILPPFPAGLQQAVFGLGCFWGAERDFWNTPGVYTTAVGYSGGVTPNPTYHEVCSGKTGQNEVVLVVFDPEVVTYEQLLKVFWEHHDPTQGMRQGNDVGTQYRSAIFPLDAAQRAVAEGYRAQLDAAGIYFAPIATTIEPLEAFFVAEAYHHDYARLNPGQSYIRYVSMPKVEKLETYFADRLK